MKKYLFIISIILLSCDTDLDINRDPDLISPEKIPLSSELPAAITGIAATQGSFYALIGGFWSQFWTQSAVANQYKSIDDYSLKPSESIINAGWAAMYDALTDVRNIKSNALRDSNWNYFLIATCLESYAFQIMVDLHGEVPFEEANNPAILNPKFDDEEYIYDKLVSNIKEALSKDFSESPSTNTPGETDLLFGGNMDKWKEFANTLLLKLYLRQTKARPNVADNGVKDLYNSNAVFLSSDAAVTQFKDEDSRSNPLYESDRRQLNVGTNLRASLTLGSYLDRNSDTRAVKYYDGTLYQAQGDYDNSAWTNAAVVELHPTDPVYFISHSESLFLQAEADLRYNGGVSAETHYNNALNAAFFRWDLDASSFLAGDYKYPNSSFDENLEYILTQKWINHFPGNGFESFIEQNRTGIPKISSETRQDSPSYVPGELFYSVEGKTSGKFPKRIVYPLEESQRNSNTPAKVELTVPVWYSK